MSMRGRQQSRRGKRRCSPPREILGMPASTEGSCQDRTLGMQGSSWARLGSAGREGLQLERTLRQLAGLGSTLWAPVQSSWRRRQE